MELDDLKDAWNNANNGAKKESLMPDTITQMAERKYYSKMKRIAYPEIGGVAVCLMGMAYTAVNFYRLDTPFLQSVGVVAILLLLALSAISFFSLRQLQMKGDVNKTYAETLKLFATQKLRFIHLQKVNTTLSYLLLVAVIILSSKIFGGKDITGNKYFWLFSFTIGYIFLVFYSKWVFRFYKNTLRQSEELLQELGA
jgi:hypothetical protein